MIFPVRSSPTAPHGYLRAATWHVASLWAKAEIGPDAIVDAAIETAPTGAPIHDVPTPPTAIELAAAYVESERQRARREAYERALQVVRSNTKAAAIRWLEREVGK